MGSFSKVSAVALLVEVSSLSDELLILAKLAVVLGSEAILNKVQPELSYHYFMVFSDLFSAFLTCIRSIYLFILFIESANEAIDCFSGILFIFSFYSMRYEVFHN